MLKHKTTHEIIRSKSANFDPSVLTWTLDEGVQLADPHRDYEFIQDPPVVSAIQYKMLFTSAERIAAKASTDPVIMDLQELLNDPRTNSIDLSLQSISDALDYMTYIGLIAIGRKAEILTGEVK
jgi:predicted membrane GTPase involved in stress response